MPSYILNFGPISISLFGVFSALAFLLGSFLLWRNLRGDFEEEEILSFSIFLPLLTIFGARLIFLLTNPAFLVNPKAWFLLRVFPGFSFFGAVSSGIFASFFWAKKKSWDFWVLADNLIIVFFLTLFLLSLEMFISGGEIFFLALTLFSFFCLLLSFFFNRNYRKFIWYKSGKPGFSACLGMAIFSGGFSLLEIFWGKGLYWERLGFFALLFLSLGFFYYRSERKLKEDIARIKGKI